MFPHKKLDWHIGRLERELADRPDDVQARYALARACLSRGLFHDGGEPWCTRALAEARRAISADPQHAGAQVLAAGALVGLGRPDGARRHVERAERIDPGAPALHLVWGALHRSMDRPRDAVIHFEQACRAAPDSWEAHLFLGRALAELAREVEPNHRLVERSQYHFVRALRLEPCQSMLGPLLRDLGRSCLQTGLHREAERCFLRLREHDDFAPTARFHLGLAAHHLGKYKNAIRHFRQYLRDRPDDPRVHRWMARCWLALGDHASARRACDKALLAAPDDTEARHVLGCAWLEAGEVEEALRVFRATLQDHPEHMPSFVELARARRSVRDVEWLAQALLTEVGHFDRLPLASGERTPRRVARERVAVLLEELKAVGPSAIAHVLRAMELVQDEGLRFSLWEAACSLSAGAVADEVAARLREPGEGFSAGLARQVLAAAASIPEPVLTRGLAIAEEDLERAAVKRKGPAADVGAHRANVESVRAEARTYQALLLLAIASRRSSAGRRLLEKWSRTADPELAIAAQAGLAMYGDPGSIAALEARADGAGAGARVRELLATVVPPPAHETPRPVSDQDDVTCSTCGRTAADAAHLMAGTEAVICDGCVVHVGLNRRSLPAPDDALCSFCGRSKLEARGVYTHNAVHICSACLDLSLGLVEREEVRAFLSAWQ